MDLFCCPICTEKLHQSGKTLRCRASHNFDLSREGYVNLLPSHHRRSAKPGDDGSMVSSRRRFLEAGNYNPLIDALKSMLLEQQNIDNLLDLGCSEGTFSHAFSTMVPQVYGVDISKPAIKTASKRYKSLNLAIANITCLPLHEDTFDVATVILAPFANDIVRVIRPGGLILRVSPGYNHLVELKQRIYQDPRPHKRANLKFPFLQHKVQQEVLFEMNLDKQAVGDLIAMTPMQHRTKSSLRNLANNDDQGSIRAEFWIDVFEKTG